MAYALSSESYCVAILVVNPGPLKALGKGLGLGDTSVEELCKEWRCRLTL
jgi:hypothetical protein